MRLLLLLISGLSFTGASQILRFTEESCTNFEPTMETVDWNTLNLGPDTNETSNTVTKRPEKLQESDKFQLELNFTQYRPNRLYTIRLLGSEAFDGFMVGVRGSDTNRSVIGRFVDVPDFASTVKCGRSRDAIVVDKGRPVRLREVELQWRAPKSSDSQEIRVEASVIEGEAFTTISSDPIALSTFPVKSDRCGKNFSCFRVCENRRRCDQDQIVYMTAADVSRDQVKFRIGGIFPEIDSYVGLGMGRQRSDMAVADLVICARREVRSVLDSAIGFPGQSSSNSPNNEVSSELYVNRFFLENEEATAMEHRGQIRLDSFALDPESGFGYCEFRRNLGAQDELDLNLEDDFYHFYFWGNLNNNSAPQMDSTAALYKSSRRVNISDSSYDVIEANLAPLIKMGSGGNTQALNTFLMLLIISALF